MIRFATEEDAQALLAIYAYYIDTEITFEYELPTEAEFRKRIRTVLEEYPYLIYEDAGICLCAPPFGAGCISVECGADRVSASGCCFQRDWEKIV